MWWREEWDPSWRRRRNFSKFSMVEIDCWLVPSLVQALEFLTAPQHASHSWRSGLSRCTQVAVYSYAGVRIPLNAHFFAFYSVNSSTYHTLSKTTILLCFIHIVPCLTKVWCVAVAIPSIFIYSRQTRTAGTRQGHTLWLKWRQLLPYLRIPCALGVCLIWLQPNAFFVHKYYLIM